jgi:acetoin utilization deacetylase AcuC-like enzyme
VTILFTHEDCLEHNPGDGHPERPARLTAILSALDHADFASLDRRRAPLAECADIALVHPAGFVDAILAAVPKQGCAMIDSDTLLSPGSGQAALRAAGAVVAAVEAVCTGEAKTAFCAVRPPGHHAEPERAMGFCLFNAIAVGAAVAEARHGLSRIAIVDFDVHHGNGTEAATEARPGWLYASSHQWPLYPGTGAAQHHGRHGNIVNAPLPPGADSVRFRSAFEERILPALDKFRPELLLISAGFDAHRRDPLAGLALETEDFGWVTDALGDLAARHAEGRIVSTLEGGYDLEALADSAAAHVRGLMASERKVQ